MALIKCPECGKDISDQSAACIHCGYPIRTNRKICCFEGVDYDLTEWEERILSFNDETKTGIQNRNELFNEISNKTGLNPIFVSLISIEARKLGHIPSTYDRNTGKPAPPVPKCPKCGSTSITSSARGINFTWGLIGASKTVNRCANCGHTWKPKR